MLHQHNLKNVILKLFTKKNQKYKKKDIIIKKKYFTLQ